MKNLSKPYLLILDLLNTHRATGLFGNELVKYSNGKLGMGSAYVKLGILNDLGYVSTELIPNDTESSPRTKWHLTEQGKRMWSMTGLAQTPIHLTPVTTLF